MARRKNEPTPVVGYLAENWPALSGSTAAVMVNPEASLGAVVSWCYGEVVSLCSVADLLMYAGEELNVRDLEATLIHRLWPLREVLGSALDGMAAARRDGGEA